MTLDGGCTVAKAGVSKVPRELCQASPVCEPNIMTCFTFITKVYLVTVSIIMAGSAAGTAPVTTITSTRGHYPHSFCVMTNMVIDAQRHKISGNIEKKEHQQYLRSHCATVAEMFGVRHDPSAAHAQCDVTFDQGYVFTIYYYHGSNYFHLHYDMMLPLYSELRQLYTGKKQGTVALLPSVETSRLQHINWSTPAFSDKTTYWMQMLKVLTGGMKLLPIDESLSEKYKTICFKKLHFGTPHVEFSDKFLIGSYVRHVTRALQVESTLPSNLRIGLIHRGNRRRILNEDELVEAVQKAKLADIETIEFSGMSFREQVLEVQRFSVLVGMNGAGLTNALYRPPGAVAVQLVQYNSTVNFREFGELLQTRGPYLEWHNTHPELTVALPHDTFNSQADTVVKVEEFVALMEKAVGLVGSDEYSIKSEL